MVLKQTSMFRIHDAVIRVSEEARKLWKSKPVLKDEKMLLSELVLCILSSQERFEVALGVRRQMDELGILRIPTGKGDFRKIEAEIIQFFGQSICYSIGDVKYERKIRFNNRKAEYIAKTLKSLYLKGGGLKDILESRADPRAVRRTLISSCFGIGPKQASMFLRNIRFDRDLAILDKHVIDYMDIMAIGQPERNFGHLSDYERGELHLQRYADIYDVELLHLDVAIWTTMRVLKGIQ